MPALTDLFSPEAKLIIPCPCCILRHGKTTSLIDDVASQDISAAEKARLLLEGASKIKGANFFPRNPPMVGAERVFVGARASGGYNAGQSPVVIVQQNGDVLRGVDAEQSIYR